MSGEFKGVKKLESGIYSMSNIEIDGKWKKIHDLKECFSDIVNRGNEIDIEELFEIMKNDEITHFEEEEPDEESSIFVKPFIEERYGL